MPAVLAAMMKGKIMIILPYIMAARTESIGYDMIKKQLDSMTPG